MYDGSGVRWIEEPGWRTGGGGVGGRTVLQNVLQPPNCGVGGGGEGVVKCCAAPGACGDGEGRGRGVGGSGIPYILYCRWRQNDRARGVFGRRGSRVRGCTGVLASVPAGGGGDSF